jgi:hypothetical protein
VIGFSFHEVMEGNVVRAGESLPFRIALRVKGPLLIRFLTRWHGVASGDVFLGGSRSAGQGTIDVSPRIERTIRYSVRFTSPAGEPLLFEGTKHNRFFFGGWRLMHGTVYDAAGAAWGAATLRFQFRRHLLGLLISIRFAFRRPQPAGEGLRG